MPEYINRAELISNLKEFANEQLTPLIENLIQKQPTADVAEVVRCRDCRFWNKMPNSAQGRCILSENYPAGTYFCANGERRDIDNG